MFIAEMTPMSCVCSSSGTCLQVTFGNGTVSMFPTMYLRDNCSKSWHPTTLQRTIPVWDLPRDLRIKGASVQTDPKGSEGSQIEVHFSDDHVSLFSSSWLYRHRLNESARLDRHCQHAKELVPWSKVDLPGGTVQSFDFEKIMDGGLELLAFVDAVATRGLVHLDNMKKEPGQVRKLAERVGHLRETNYGPVFEVKVEPNAINQAFTAAELPLHTDLPFYTLPPGVQILHCIKQSTHHPAAGRSLFVDGLAVARRLREVDPHSYKVLTEYPAVFEDIAPGKFHLRTERCVIKEFHVPQHILDDVTASNIDLGMGKGVSIPVEINFNNGVRGAELNLPADKVADFYRALSRFGDIAHEPELSVEMKLNAGEAVVFQNRRVLHGRRAIDVVPSRPVDEIGSAGSSIPEHDALTGTAVQSSRWLQGGYFDLDALHSCRRVLQHECRAESKL
eukprot:m.39756 g.39756  ORF g.39756 m.39756 type:complete len:448 (+) comp14746_c0_seq1:278-1621(+)